MHFQHVVTQTPNHQQESGCASNTMVRQTPSMTHRRSRRPARATSAPVEDAGCAPIFNGCTKDFVRQLDSCTPTDRIAHKKSHAHYFQRFFGIFIIIVFIKIFGFSTTLGHPTTHQNSPPRAPPNTGQHLDTAPQQTRGDDLWQHVQAAEPRADIYYHHHMRRQPKQVVTNNYINNIDQQVKSLYRQPSNAILKYHRHRHHEEPRTPTAIRKVLPSGPPPFRPSTIVLGLNSIGALDKLKGTKIFKRMYKSKVYYLFMDVLEQLATMVDKIAQKKIELAETQVATVQAVAHKFLMKSGQMLKLKWPLVMLNPQFIKEILSNPTLLVMLFHAIEVAYLSMPASFWLKPLVKLVKQPTPEKEEETWWRRKRIYEVLNGPGSSELQPNLKTKHFRQPGDLRAPSISLAGLAQAIRQLTGKPETDPTYYSYPPGYTLEPAAAYHYHQHHRHHNTRPLEAMPEQSMPVYQDSTDLLLNTNSLPTHGHNHLTNGDYQEQTDQKYYANSNGYMSSQQVKAFLENQQHYGQPPVQHPYGQEAESSVQYASSERQGRPPVTGGAGHSTHAAAVGTTAAGGQLGQSGSQVEASVPTIPDDNGSNLDISNAFLSVTRNNEHPDPSQRHSTLSSASQLMSQTDFEMLDPREKELILEETRKSHLEARLADELIKQQSEFVDSIVRRHDAIERRQHHEPMQATMLPPKAKQVHGHAGGARTRPYSLGHKPVDNDMDSFMTKSHDFRESKSNDKPRARIQAANEQIYY